MITNKQIIKQINESIPAKKPLLYVTRQAERGQGLENLLTGYKIISASRNTAEILEKIKLSGNQVIVFKNNPKIQRLCAQKKLKLLNPPCFLTEKYENKISQYQWLKKIIPENLPKTIITQSAKTSFQALKKEIGSPFIYQFNRSHTGEGTFLISRQNQWQELMKKFPFREIKCAVFIKKPIITINVCLWQNCVLTGNPSYQITGIKELTDFIFSTVGNDWGLAKKILSSYDLKNIKELSQIIGQNMVKEGWRGLFGLDLIKDKKWLVIEINARQPASTGLETLLQRNQGKGITILATHFAGLLDLPLPASCSEMQKSLQKIEKGSRLIVRKKNKNIVKLKNLRKMPGTKITLSGLKNEKHNAELFQIQNFNNGLVKNNGQLNKIAREIIKC